MLAITLGISSSIFAINPLAIHSGNLTQNDKKLARQVIYQGNYLTLCITPRMMGESEL